MRRRTRGRGSSRGARGGGSTSSRNNSTSTAPADLGPTTKGSTTILTTFQRQSSPYIRQLRGGIGQTIKRAINSIINDNDIMNNNTFSNSIPMLNGSLDHPGKVNGVHGKTNGEVTDGYLHKKFKKVNNVEVPVPLEKKNGVISIPQNNTLTLIKGDEGIRTTPQRSEKEEGHNGTINGLVSAHQFPSVYKPKFRLSTTKEPVVVEEVKQNNVVQNQRLVHHESQPFLPASSHHHRPCVDDLPKDEPVQSMHPAYMNSHPTRHVSLPQMLSPGMLTNGGSGGGDDRRIDRQSLDDRISKIIHDNQSILATWPEHLNKRTKGSGGRYSLSTRSGTQSFGMGFGGEPSRKDSLEFVMSSGSESAEILSKRINSQQKLNGHLSRSNSDAGQHFFYHQDRMDSMESGCEDLSKHSESFTVPKKRRRLSPVMGILSGGEVAEIPNALPKQHLTVPIATNPYPTQRESEVDMTLRVSNCGNSGAKVTIRTTGVIDQSMIVPPPHSKLTLQDESSNSSSTSSSKSLFSPDPRQSMIRIRKNSIFETESSPSPASVPAPIRRRGRPSKVNHEEAPKIRKVVERLQSHLNARTAALAAVVASSTSPKPSSSAETEKSQLLVAAAAAMSSKPVITTAKHNHDITKVPAPQSTINTKPEPVEIQSTSSLLLQTTALNPKRPTFLALKPADGIVAKKRLGQMDSILPSPETPRGAKNYNQMHINGNAYTYLGFKISTKSSYTCLFKPQPMFVPQETDPKLSMYSNWQPRPRDPNEETKLKLSAYDSRINFRKSGEPIFITSMGNSFDTLTINSPENSSPKFTLLDVCGETLTRPELGNTSERVFARLSQHSASGQYEFKAQAPLMSLPDSRSPSPLPSPGTPELTIDERPLAERITATPSPKPVIATSADVHAEPPKSLQSPPIQDLRMNETHVERSPRYRKKSIYFPPTSGFLNLPQEVNTSSCSESSSADELGSMPPMAHHSRDFEHPTGKGRSISLCIDSRKNDVSLDTGKPLSLMVGGTKDRQRSQSVSLSSPSAILNNLDSARVKIMDGGFESNEDYTYVRGRGRGRYVCESCGIRCKKPSMLRKHLKTHTDLRPYTCKLCNFSFKTKGNLTKHQKSKSHHKKCIGLGIHPDSSRSLEMTGPMSDSNDEGDSDDDDEDDNENDSDSSDDDQDDDSRSTTTTTDNSNNDKEKLEKEIALSLLDLGQLSRLPENRDRAISESNTNDSSGSLPLSGRKVSSFSAPAILQSDPRNASVDLEAPIDLSVKTTRTSSQPEPQPKFFGGIIKTMEIVGEAQPWEPEEEFLRNGYLNLTKVRNHVEEDKKMKESRMESIKVEAPEPPQLNSSAVEQDKPFQFEITKRRRVVSLCDTVVPPSSSSKTPPRNSSTSLSLSSPPLVVSATPVAPTAEPRGSSPLPGTSTVSRPVRLHQPWLSPQGPTPEVFQQNNGREIVNTTTPSNGLDRTSAARAAVERMEDELELEETLPPGVPVSLTKTFGTNGIKILPTTSNGTSNFQGFGSALGLKPKAEFRQPSGAQLLDEGKAECNVCGKTFTRPGQLTLHMNIHYLERPFRCDPCGVSFRTKGHLIKHRRSSSHDCKVYLTEAWGVANEENPRPFKCADCKIAFRIHGHLAKHLRSKMHIMRMECLGKLPFGIYFEMEKSGLNLNEIDTTDCDMSLVSLQGVAQKIYGDEWREKLSAPIEDPV